MYVLDTDTLSHLWYKHEKVSHQVRSVGSTAPLAITLITKIEVLEGRYSSIRKAATGAELLRAVTRLADTEQLLSQMTVLNFDSYAIEIFDRLRHEKKLTKIGRADLLIACISLANDATLVTRNVKDFKNVPGLHAENWTD